MLARRLMEAARGLLVCEVIAPSLVPVRPGQRVKTDRRDARKLVHLYRWGELTVVHAPTETEESVRDLMRCREDAREDLLRARHRLSKFLQRRGRVYREGRAWSRQHATWLSRLQWEHTTDEDVFGDYQFDLRRFTRAPQLMAHLRLMPSESTTAERRRQGGLTKTGNSHVRRVVIESAWHARHKPAVGKQLQKRRVGQPAWVIAHADRAMSRLHRRYWALALRGKPHNKVVAAVARELVGFLWAVMQEGELRQQRRQRRAA